MKLELRADVTRLWPVLARSVYTGNLANLAVREVLQNSIDACRRAVRAGQVRRGAIRFTCTRQLQDGEMALVCEDNGCGMDLDDLQERFLTLGQSGKTAEREAVGGFGLAKAVILGCGSEWSIETQCVHLDSRTMEPSFSAWRQGTRIEVRDVSKAWTSDMRHYLEWSDVSDVDLFWNGERVRPALKLREEILIPDRPDTPGIQVSARLLPRSIRVQIVRLNGLVQWWQPNDAGGFVLDVQTALRPDEPGYPFDASRERFAGDWHDVDWRIRDTLRMNKLAADPDRMLGEIWVPAGDLVYTHSDKTDETALQSSACDLPVRQSPEWPDTPARTWEAWRTASFKRRFAPEKHLRLLSAWTRIVDLVIGRTKFDPAEIKTGFVLKREVRGLCMPERRSVLLNPFEIPRGRAALVGIWLWNLAVHEVAHLLAGTYHDEAFSRERENLALLCADQVREAQRIVRTTGAQREVRGRRLRPRASASPVGEGR